MKTKSLISINLIINILLFIFLVLFFQKLQAVENKIIFKINNKAFTTIDYEMRVQYLDFVGNNNSLKKEVIIDDFISANLFYEHYLQSKQILDYDNKIIQIFNNIKNVNEKNKKKYNYELDKNNILFNIKIDFIRKTILENLLNTNKDNLMLQRDEIDLLYNFKLKYINFESSFNEEIKKEINDLDIINIRNIKNILIKNNVVFFIKEKELQSIKNVNKVIKENIILNNKFFKIEDKNKITYIFIEKRFETLNGVIADLYSIRSNEKIEKDQLKCRRLINKNNNENVMNKEYKFSDLNKELKQNLININDYVMFTNEQEYIYIILCNIKFDKEIMENSKINKLININVAGLEEKFIKKYSKIYNLIKTNE